MKTKQSAEQLAAEVYETPMTDAEFSVQVAAHLNCDAEMAEARALIEWFQRQYPTVEARLRYVSRHARRARSLK
jgi:hypothetical protein